MKKASDSSYAVMESQCAADPLERVAKALMQDEA
jgi:hypothetical protein